MSMLRKLFTLLLMTGALAAPLAHAQTTIDPAIAQQQANTTAAAAATATGQVPQTPDFLEHVVDMVLEIFDVRSSGNTTTHYVVAGVFLIGALLLRRVLTSVVFAALKKLAERTKSTLDDKLFPALETPTATLVMVAGIVCALKVLKLSETTDAAIRTGSTVAFSIVVFWCVMRAFGAVLDHFGEISREKNLGIAAFMPWIKKSLITLMMVFGVLMILQSMGYNVKAVLAGLGIGGLAFALAAQDTLANLFGSLVVAIDQPFKIGEAIKVGANEGLVEDIGLRSTKLRTPQNNLIVVPNRTMATEAITNNSRFIRRRQEQVLGLTYDTTPDQMEAIVKRIREIVEGEAEVDKGSVHVYFRDYSASSLDIWIAYNTKDPDFVKFMKLRMRINLAVMRAVQSSGLDFAFPTQTMNLPPAMAGKLFGGTNAAAAKPADNAPAQS